MDYKVGFRIGRLHSETVSINHHQQQQQWRRLRWQQQQQHTKDKHLKSKQKGLTIPTPFQTLNSQVLSLHFPLGSLYFLH